MSGELHPPNKGRQTCVVPPPHGSFEGCVSTFEVAAAMRIRSDVPPLEAAAPSDQFKLSFVASIDVHREPQPREAT